VSTLVPINRAANSLRLSATCMMQSDTCITNNAYSRGVSCVALPPVAHSVINYLEQKALSEDQIASFGSDPLAVENVHVMAKLLMSLRD